MNLAGATKIAICLGAALSAGLFAAAWGVVDLPGLGLAALVVAPWALLFAALQVRQGTSSQVLIAALVGLLFVASVFLYGSAALPGSSSWSAIAFVSVPAVALPIAFLVWLLAVLEARRFRQAGSP